jgi:uroporphyrinogen-III synthase
MRVIVTRPAAQAAQWVADLSARGIDAVALPLIAIEAPPDQGAVERAWLRLAQQRLVVFVSPNAVERFFASKPAALAWPEGVQAASTGPGTSDALRRSGVAAGAIVEPAADAPAFDSAALWRRLEGRDWAGAHVLVVRGDGGRDWLAQTLAGRGADVEFVAAYRRVAPRFEGVARQCLDDALARPAHHLWLFSSSESIDHLRTARPDATWSGARALATHPRIAEAARECGFGAVHESLPTLDAVVACIQSIPS